MNRYKRMLWIVWRNRFRINNPNDARWNARLWRVTVKVLGDLR